MDLPAAVETKYGLPVHHVKAVPDWFEGEGVIP
jgi:hypothetical protein